MNETGFDPKVANRSKLADKRKAKVSEKEHREAAHEARLHTLDQICRLRDSYPGGNDLEGHGYILWSQLDDILNEHFAKIVSGNYDLAKGLPETLYILTTELAEERLRADKAQHDAAVLREQLTDAETMYRIDRDVYEEIKAIARGCKIDHTRDPQWVIRQIREYVANTREGLKERIRQMETLLREQRLKINGLEETKAAFGREISSQREKIAELTNQIWSPENHPQVAKECPNPEVHAEVGRLTRANDELSIKQNNLLNTLNSKDAEIARKVEGLGRQSDKILNLERELRETKKATIEQGSEARRLAVALETALEIIRLHELARTALVNYHQSKDALAKVRESARVQEKAQAAYWTEMSEVDKQRNEKEHELLKLRETKEEKEA